MADKADKAGKADKAQKEESKGVSLDWLKHQLEGFSDKVAKTLKAPAGDCELLFVRSLCDSVVISRDVVVPFYEVKDLSEYQDYIASFPGSSQPKSDQDALSGLLDGYVFLNILGESYLFEAYKAQNSSVKETLTESVVQGPSDALTENLQVNLNLVRRRYPTPKLKIEMVTIGKTSKTKSAIIYDEERVNPEVLDELKKKVDKIEADMMQSMGQLEKEVSDEHFRIFPKTVVTERPDRVVYNLARGKVAVLMDTTGFALVLPTVFTDFFAAMDDRYQLPLVGRFLKLMRYLGLVMTLLIPALYVAFTSYNPEIMRIQIALLVAGSRATVPYPSFVEVLLMLLMMEFLTEASLRLPKAIGPTATTVGGLILGQAATQAGLVGNIMIILVSAVAISNFLIPLNMMSFAVRVVKYAFIFLAALFGLFGVAIGVVGLIMYLCNLRSFGQPYMKVFPLDQLGPAKRGGGNG